MACIFVTELDTNRKKFIKHLTIQSQALVGNVENVPAKAQVPVLKQDSQLYMALWYSDENSKV